MQTLGPSAHIDTFARDNYPRSLTVVKELPKTQTGKIQNSRLRQS